MDLKHGELVSLKVVVIAVAPVKLKIDKNKNCSDYLKNKTSCKSDFQKRIHFSKKCGTHLRDNIR